MSHENEKKKSEEQSTTGTTGMRKTGRRNGTEAIERKSALNRGALAWMTRIKVDRWKILSKIPGR